jgi:dephospho-CoA kinase
MTVIGLTGGIASGKSTVSALLAQKGAVIVDADLIARQVVAPHSQGLKALVQQWGEGILSEDGTLNRAQLGSLIFADPSQRKVLDAIIHPLIFQESTKQIQEGIQSNAPLVVYDAALLFESGRSQAFKPIVVVYTKPSIQKQRLMLRDQIDEAAAQKKLAAQMSVEEKKALADFVIENHGDLKELSNNVDLFWEKLIDLKLIQVGY